MWLITKYNFKRSVAYVHHYKRVKWYRKIFLESLPEEIWASEISGFRDIHNFKNNYSFNYFHHFWFEGLKYPSLLKWSTLWKEIIIIRPIDVPLITWFWQNATKLSTQYISSPCERHEYLSVICEWKIIKITFSLECFIKFLCSYNVWLRLRGKLRTLSNSTWKMAGVYVSVSQLSNKLTIVRPYMIIEAIALERWLHISKTPTPIPETYKCIST